MIQKRQLGITIDHYPESWKKRAMAGEQIAIPGTSAFDAYIGHWLEIDPDFANKNLMRFVKAFKATYDQLECYPKGIKRAEKAFNEIGKRISRGIFKRKQEGEAPPSCKAQCSACCHIRVTLTDSEAEALVDYLKARDVKLDRELVQLQHEKAVTDEDHIKLPYEKRVCPILGADGNCRAYEARPLVCRKFMVASPPWMCDMRLSSQSAFIIDPEVEGFTAAQMALESPEKVEDDNLPTQLLKRISDDDRLWIKAAAASE